MKPMVAPVSGAGEGFLDAATSRRIIGALRPFVQHPTRAAKNLAIPVGQVRERDHKTVMKRDPTGLAAFNRGKCPEIRASTVEDRRYFFRNCMSNSGEDFFGGEL